MIYYGHFTPECPGQLHWNLHSEEYKDDIVIYKVNTEIEQELSAAFQIRSIPSMLFIPMDKKPMMQAGALPKNALKEAIESELIAKEKV